MAADTAVAASPEEQLEALQREAEALKQRLEDERQKLNDVTLCAVAERLEPINLSGLKPRRVLKGHSAKVLCCDWSPDRRRLASSAQDGRVLVWDAWAAARDAQHSLPATWTLAVAWAPGGNVLAAGGLDCRAHVVPADEPGARRTVATHAAYVSAAAFPRTERQLLTASGDGSCALWDVEAGQLLQTFAGHAADVLALDAAPAADAFVSGGADRAVLAWDMRSGRAAAAFEGHGSDVTAVRYHPSGDALGSGCDDAAVRLFDLRADRELARLARESGVFGAASVDFSPSGRLVFAGYGDHTACVWDALRGARVCVLCGHEHRVSRVRVSPDGTALATASWDGTLRVWA